MSHTIEQLRAAPDDELVRLHDKLAEHTITGVTYYLDELQRREQLRAMQSSQMLALASFVLSAANAVVAVVAVVVALAAGGR